MPKNTYQQYIKHLNSITETFDKAVYDYGRDNLPDPVILGILVRSQNALQHICGDESPYTQKVKVIADESYALSYKVELTVGIIRALVSDMEDGYLESISELARGEMFDNYLEMARHLLNEGYKDAAAVIAGSSLEIHLRQLCVKEHIPTSFAASDGSTRHKKAEQLNQELGKATYSLLDQKQVTAWLHLRNSAAHGNYSNYSDKQVTQLIEWVQDFITKNPA